MIHVLCGCFLFFCFVSEKYICLNKLVHAFDFRSPRHISFPFPPTGRDSTAVKRLSMREKLRGIAVGIASFDSKNPACGCNDGCTFL